MSHIISVQTGARLHFGLFATQSESGRSFGGVGLMIDQPGCQLTATHAEQDQIDASGEIAPRLASWLATYRTQCPEQFRPTACRISIQSEIPMHAGLGSGTQTALAVAAALSQLAQEPVVAIPELARRVQRGRRSAIGLHGFRQGGLLAEAGKMHNEEISPLLSRVDFPADWKILLVMPTDQAGLSGDSERTAFAELGPMPPQTTRRLHDIAEHEFFPAVQARDFEATAIALHEFGRLNGEYFAPVQGGLFADPRLPDLADWLIARGCRGVGQSSWGPTLFALCRDNTEASERQREIQCRMPSHFQVFVTSAMNQPARVNVS